MTGGGVVLYLIGKKICVYILKNEIYKKIGICGKASTVAAEYKKHLG